MNTEDYYRDKAMKQLKIIRDRRFRKNMNLFYFVAAIGTVSILLLYLIF